VWRFSKNNILTGILGAACFTTGIMNIVMAGQTIQHNTIGKDTGEVIAVFAVGAAGRWTRFDGVKIPSKPLRGPLNGGDFMLVSAT
jgi:hypothetical protein